MPEIAETRRLAIASLVVAAIVLLFGLDGTLHWDEPGYLYAGIYQTLGEILRAEVQPSGLPDFTTGKLLHVLFIHLVFGLTDSPPATFFIVAGSYVLLLGLGLWLAYRITARLLPEAPTAAYAGMLAVALVPTVAYLAFKTLSDIPALFLSTLATFAILRAATTERSGVVWLGLGIVALAMAVLAKAQAVVLPATFVLAALLLPPAGLERRRVLVNGAVVGLAAGLLTVVVLFALSIGIGRFVGSSDLLVKPSPLVAKLMHIAITGGLVWIVLPLSLLTTHYRALGFFWAWFLLATVPFLVLFEHVEPRYLAGSLVPLVGIAALALEGVWRWLGPVFHGRRRAATVAAGVLAILLLGSNVLALRVMPHEVALFELRATLARLDARYGEPQPNLLTAWRFTDFHTLRVLWPDRPVWSVDSTPLLVEPRSAQTAEELATAFLDGRQLSTPAELADLEGPLLLIGFEETFAPVNLARIADVLRPGIGRELLDSLNLIDHLETSWVWHADDLTLEPVSRTAHYRVFEVHIAPATDVAPAADNDAGD